MSDKETCSSCGEEEASAEYLTCSVCADAHDKAVAARARAEALEEAAVLCETARASRSGYGSLTNGNVFAERIRALIATPAPATIPVERVREVLQTAYAGASDDHDLNATAALASVCEQLGVDPEPLRENGCYLWCVVEGEHEICLSGILGESEPLK